MKEEDLDKIIKKSLPGLSCYSLNSKKFIEYDTKPGTVDLPVLLSNNIESLLKDNYHSNSKINEMIITALVSIYSNAISASDQVKYLNIAEKVYEFDSFKNISKKYKLENINEVIFTVDQVIKSNMPFRVAVNPDPSKPFSKKYKIVTRTPLEIDNNILDSYFHILDTYPESSYHTLRYIIRDIDSVNTNSLREINPKGGNFKIKFKEYENIFNEKITNVKKIMESLLIPNVKEKVIQNPDLVSNVFTLCTANVFDPDFFNFDRSYSYDELECLDRYYLDKNFYKGIDEHISHEGRIKLGYVLIELTLKLQFDSNLNKLKQELGNQLYFFKDNNFQENFEIITDNMLNLIETGDYNNLKDTKYLTIAK